ncbi:MAG: hypothetical protein JWO95_3028 [Verrucomicrobiales bacterium]|nr:hypothetical protein [Verrucomicrobiales bacterium]
MFDLEQAIARWREQMLAAGIQSLALDELEGHLRDDIDRQIINGQNLLEQSFKVAIGQIGSATSLKTEFKKVTVMKTQKTEKIIGAVGFGAFAVISVCSLFSNVVETNASQKLIGLAAIAFTGGLLFASAHAWRVLPVIPTKSLRITLAIASAVLGAVATAFVFNVVMPRFNLSLAQIAVTALWALQPLIVGSALAGGLIEAANRRLTSAT